MKSFAIYLMQRQLPVKVLQTLMGRQDTKPKKKHTRVFALHVTRPLGSRFSLGTGEARSLLGSLR
ncbi:hypothetical protein ACOZB2_31685 [Pantoea endophytica]